jgi:hypothetical protein
MMPTLLASLLLFAAAIVAMPQTPDTPSPDTLVSVFSPAELELSTDPASPNWAKAPRVIADRNFFAEPIAGAPTEVRSRWTKEHLYLFYVCPYDELNLKPEPNVKEETSKLWNWDVAEAFIGSTLDRITRYKEFQVSPQGEWVDLDIDRDDQQGQAGDKWNSGFSVAARIDAPARIWYGVMKIPFASLDTRPAEKGRTFRAGLYRIAGTGATKKYYAWRPTGEKNFHVPKAFGTIRLD